MASDIDFRLIAAENLAASLVEEMGICTPEHIWVRDIAFKKGAMVVEERVPGAAASIVRLGEHATIRVPPGDSMARKRFSIGHELGHLLMDHVQSIQKVCSNDDMLNWYQSSQETQANFFASELLLPKRLVAKRCDVESVSFDPIMKVAKDFRASLTATAIKFVRLCPEQCALVCSENGAVKWFYKSPSWHHFVKREPELDKRTIAYDFFDGVRLEEDPQEVDADAWIESRGIDEIVEHAVASTKFRFVLSLLWVRPN